MDEWCRSDEDKALELGDGKDAGKTYDGTGIGIVFLDLVVANKPG